MIYQFDGNLVLYKLAYANGPTTTPIWAANAFHNQVGTTVDFQNDGNLVLYRPSTSGGQIAYWSGAVSATNPIWILQDDGNLVGYRSFTSAFPQITGHNPYASTATDGGKKSIFFGKLNIL